MVERSEGNGRAPTETYGPEERRGTCVPSRYGRRGDGSRKDSGDESVEGVKVVRKHVCSGSGTGGSEVRGRVEGLRAEEDGGKDEVRREDEYKGRLYYQFICVV